MKSEKLLDLFEREAEFLTATNHTQVVEVRFDVTTVTGRATLWRLQNFAPLIKANGLDVHSGAGRELADSHSPIFNLIPRYRLKILVKRLWPDIVQSAWAGSHARDEGRMSRA